MNKKEFAKVVLDENFTTFILYIVALEVFSWNTNLIILDCSGCQSKVKQSFDQTYIIDFLSNLAIKLPKNYNINEICFGRV